MKQMTTNANLHKAKKEKNDEFYTFYDDIEKEVSHYKKHFRNKVVYINCDNPTKSNFWKFFVNNFREYKLKLLLCSWIGTETEMGGWCKYDGKSEWVQYRFQLAGSCNGDFRHFDDLIDRCDIVVGNPPFSLFRDFIDAVKKKDLLVVSTLNAITYKNVFPLIFDGIIKTGYNEIKKFDNNGKVVSFGCMLWFTTFPVDEKPFLELTKHYTQEKYHKYDNYDAINVDKVKDIPCDYNGVMGVPITFLLHHNPKQFELVSFEYGMPVRKTEAPKTYGDATVNGKNVYRRMMIQRNI